MDGQGAGAPRLPGQGPLPLTRSRWASRSFCTKALRASRTEATSTSGPRCPGAGEGHRSGEWDLVVGLALCRSEPPGELSKPAGRRWPGYVARMWRPVPLPLCCPHPRGAWGAQGPGSSPQSARPGRGGAAPGGWRGRDSTLTSGGGAGLLRGGRGAPSWEPQPAADRGPQPAQLAFGVPPGALGPGQLLLQAADLAAGCVQAGLEAASLAAGLPQLPGGITQLGPEGLLHRPTLLEAPLQLRLPGLAAGLRLCQLPLQPQDLRGPCGRGQGPRPRHSCL